MTEYFFWAYRHEVWTMLTQTYSNKKLLFCVISNEGIKLYSSSGLTEVSIPLPAIKECAVFHGARSLIAEISISINSQKPVTLIPINPFDPAVFFHRNDAETQTMKEVLATLKNGAQPSIDPNPYNRQLITKDVPKYALDLQNDWNAKTSPWIYYNLNVSKVDWKRKLNAIIARIFIIAGILATILAIIYILLNLSAV
jgi:hypothetical protein